VQPDPAKALEYLLRAGDLHHPQALYLVGLMYETGDGVPRDMEVALNAFFKSSSYGCQFSQYALGLFYLYGVEDCELITKGTIDEELNFVVNLLILLISSLSLLLILVVYYYF
jgi:TPR repeat protein